MMPGEEEPGLVRMAACGFADAEVGRTRSWKKTAGWPAQIVEVYSQ